MRRLTPWIVWAVVLLVASVLGATPPMQALEAAMQAHQSVLLGVTGGILFVGFLLFMGGVLDLIIHAGEPMSHRDVEDMVGRGRTGLRHAWRASAHRIRGRTAGSQGHDQFSFREAKDAWHSGAWLRDARWRRRYITTAGGLMTFIGLFGIFFVLGPAAIKLILGGALLYALVSMGRGFARA
ncbi:MAG TPA: hypothetical protein VHG28_22560 [Longimicrobiaceae bacterium]|nr:hypothetical protein [Longimicrobiaceae bacterium]